MKNKHMLNSHRKSSLTGLIGLIAITGGTQAFASPAPNPSFTYQDLGTLAAVPYNVNSLGNGLNLTGTVAGVSTDALGNSGQATNFTGAAKTGEGELGGPYSTATAVNNSGQFVGYGLLADGNTNRAFLSNGTANSVASLGTFAGGALDNSFAFGINTSGEIVGASANSGVAGTPSQAFLIKTNTPTPGANPNMVSLGSIFAGGNSQANGINTAGTVVGSSDTSANGGTSAAFIWTPSTANGTTSVSGMQKLGPVGTLGGGFGSASAINANGIVVGDSNVPAGQDHAFYATVSGGVYTLSDIQTLGSNGAATAINTAGTAVGYFTDINGLNSRAFLYTVGGGMVDLNSLVTNIATGYTLASANGINDNNQITGTAINGAGVTRAFLLSVVVPAPEPAPLTVLTLGVAGLGGLMLRARRRTVMAAV